MEYYIFEPWTGDDYLDDYGFIRDEFLDESDESNDYYKKYKKFVLDRFDPTAVVLSYDGILYVNDWRKDCKRFQLQIIDGDVVTSPSIEYNPLSLKQLSAKVIAENYVPYEIFPRTLQQYIQNSKGNVSI